MSRDESTGRLATVTRKVFFNCVYLCNGLYQQQEWDCSFGGLNVQVPAAGET